MAGRKKTILDEVETVESAVAAELTQSNNLNKPGSTSKTTRTKKTAVTEETEQPKKTTRTKKVAESEETAKTAKTTKTGKATKAKTETEPEQSDNVEKVTKKRKTAKTDKTETTDAPEKVTKTRKTAKAEKAPEAETVILADTVAVTDATDDIVDYIQPSSLEALKARYGAAEEDEQIRNEGFELARKSGLVRRPHPEETSFDYYSVPTASEDITTNVDTSLSEAFDSTKSDYDADTVSFEDIATEQKRQPVINPPVSQEAIRATGNRYGYDTHTTVIYYDESTEDGIQRNTEDELTSAFTSDNKRKRRIFPWLRKRK